ncbi:hypothetical protein phiFa_451 [Thermus phage phiFa]|nr:hypothetical protein phiFa_45 [Thermus phage phiFa]QKE11353.1 hypothetical protein phiFa_451 [Thermus phage phiFa]
MPYLVGEKKRVCRIRWPRVPPAARLNRPHTTTCAVSGGPASVPSSRLWIARLPARSRASSPPATTTSAGRGGRRDEER